MGACGPQRCAGILSIQACYRENNVKIVKNKDAERKISMKKIISVLLTAAMAAALLSGCAQDTDKETPEKNVQAEEPAEETAGQPDAETRIFTDMLGREVEIPTQIDTIVPLGNAPRMIVYLGLADRAVGIEECEIAKSPLQAYAYPYVEEWSRLPNCGTNSMGETAYYPEQIMQAGPDVILTTDPADVADNLQNQTGIPVVCVSQGTLFGEDYEQSLRTLAEVCGVQDRAEALIGFIQDTLADLSARAASAAEEKKPSVLGAAATFKGGHSIDGVYTNYSVFEILEANDVAEEIAGQKNASGVMVEKEQILAWDPEIIFLDAGNVGLVNTDYAENPEYFEQLQAVQNGNIYQWPNSTWHWSNVEIPLVSAYYVGSLLYPEAFADIKFEEKASEIFETFLGEPDYLSILEEAGAGYGKVVLGD